MSESIDPLPFHWYVFFGILEPISVAAGCIYAVFYQENFHLESVPLAFAKAPFYAAGLTRSPSWPAISMTLGQLGSCYFLAGLNSTLSFYAIHRHVKDPVLKEKLLKSLFLVLAGADITHILLTIYALPAPPPSYWRSLTTSRPVQSALEGTLAKLHLLAKPSSWNSLLFGNIIITLILFCFRVLWWSGFARGKPSSTSVSISGVPSGAQGKIKSS